MIESYSTPACPIQLRQVKRPIKQSNGICGPSYREEVIGWDTTVQRKWFVFDSLPHDTKPCMGSVDGSMVNGVNGREEWRDLPIVYFHEIEW